MRQKNGKGENGAGFLPRICKKTMENMLEKEQMGFRTAGGT